MKETEESKMAPRALFLSTRRITLSSNDRGKTVGRTFFSREVVFGAQFLKG